MARTASAPARWSVKFEMNPQARRVVLGANPTRDQLQETGRMAKAQIAAAVTNPAYRSRLLYRTYQKNGEWRLWVGTYSSFAHWEEFGAVNWRGPIAPMRRTMHRIGLRISNTDGKNSMRSPS